MLPAGMAHALLDVAAALKQQAELYGDHVAVDAVPAFRKECPETGGGVQSASVHVNSTGPTVCASLVLDFGAVPPMIARRLLAQNNTPEGPDRPLSAVCTVSAASPRVPAWPT